MGAVYSHAYSTSGVGVGKMGGNLQFQGQIVVPTPSWQRRSPLRCASAQPPPRAQLAAASLPAACAHGLLWTALHSPVWPWTWSWPRLCTGTAQNGCKTEQKKTKPKISMIWNDVQIGGPPTSGTPHLPPPPKGSPSNHRIGLPLAPYRSHGDCADCQHHCRIINP